MVDKKTKKDVTGILGLGIGLQVGTAVEAKVAPAVPVFPTFAPVAATAAPVVGAGIALRQVNRLSMIGNRPIMKGRQVIRKKTRGFL